MRHFNFLFFILPSIASILGDSQEFSKLEPTGVTTLERRTPSKPNRVVCSVSAGPPLTADLNDCLKIATHLASKHKDTCGFFKSCILMTRAGFNNPQPVKSYTATEFRYYVQVIFKFACKVSRPVHFRKKEFKESPDDQLFITPAFLDPPLKEQKVQICDKELAKFMATIPLPSS